MIQKVISRDCEFSCDETVIKRLDKHGKKAYGSALINSLENGLHGNYLSYGGEHDMKKFLLKRLLFILSGVTAYIVTKYAQYNPDWTEQVYSRSVYPVLSAAVGFLPSLVGFSVTEWLVVLFLLFCLGYIVYYVGKVIKSKEGRGMTAYRGMAEAAAIFCIVYFVFTAIGIPLHITPDMMWNSPAWRNWSSFARPSPTTWGG